MIWKTSSSPARPAAARERSKRYGWRASSPLRSCALRDDADHRFLVIDKAHAPIQRMGCFVVTHDVQERQLVAQQLTAYQLERQAARVALALIIGMRADAADLAQPLGADALPGHRDQAF